MNAKKILKNVVTIIGFSLLAKVMSFVVETIVANKFGASQITDSYYMVIGITQMISPMISVGIWKVFLPEYKSKLVLNDYEGANRITSKLYILFSAIVLIMVLGISLFPVKILNVFAPGFTEAEITLSAKMLKVVATVFIFNLLATIPSAILQANEKFSKSQSKEIFQLIPPILFLVIAPIHDESATIWLCAMNVFGAMLASIIMNYYVRKKYKFCISGKFFDKDIIGVLKNIPIACLNSIINQLNNVIDKAFASGLQAGSITCLNYGSKLIYLFDGIFSNAVSMAFFPNITELIAKGEKRKLKSFIKEYICIMSAILIPISIFIILFSTEIVKIVFGHGNFSGESISITAKVFVAYSIGLLAMGITTGVNDIFYILKKTKMLTVTTVANIGLNILFDLIFIRKYDVVALSLATTISLYISLLIKIIIIREYIDFDKQFKLTMLQAVVYSLIAVLVVYFMKLNIRFSSMIVLIIGGIIYFIIYSGLIMIFPNVFRSRVLKLTGRNIK